MSKGNRGKACLLELARYIVLSPVRARMVRSVEDWPCNSDRATSGMTEPGSWLTTDWVLSNLGKDRKTIGKIYRESVRQGKISHRPGRR